MCVYVCTEEEEKGETEMDKRFLNGGDGTGENAKSGGNGFYLRECILTGKETAKYKTQCGEGESARTDLG